MVHWIFILVGFAFGFFFGAAIMISLNKRNTKAGEDLEAEFR